MISIQFPLKACFAGDGFARRMILRSAKVSYSKVFAPVALLFILWVSRHAFAQSCTPLTFCPPPDNCGTIPDGCGGTVTCGVCNSPEYCGAGGNPNVCAVPPNTCVINNILYTAGTQNPANTCQVCNPAINTSDWTSSADGSACNDNNACTQVDSCQGGVCVGSAPVTCSPLDQCHSGGTCNPGTGQCMYSPIPDGTPCNDGNACTQSDVCQSGTCTGTNPVTCSPSDQCHSAGTCDPTSGQCSNPTAPDGTTCTGTDSCGDVCTAGVCSASASCNPATNLVVTTVADDAGNAANCTLQQTAGTGTDRSCSLRDALLFATTAGSGNISFDGTVFAASNSVAANTITLTKGALNIPSNTGITFGPATIKVATGSGPPLGLLVEAIDNVTFSTTVGQANMVKVDGWVADPQDGAPMSNVTVYIDGNSVGAPTLGLARPNVAATYNNPAYLNSGYQLLYPAASLVQGTHRVTVVAVDSASRSTTFGPRTFTVAASAGLGSPIGGLGLVVDSVTSSTTISQADSLKVTGWVGDPQDGSPLSNVQVYVDGTSIGTPTLGVVRSDIAATYGNAYLHSGYRLLYPASSLSTGTHQVTVVAVDSGGRSVTLGPRTITVQ